MKSINYLVFNVFALVITVSSCKKDKSNTLTPENMLTAKSWKYISAKWDGVEYLLDCGKDDIMTFDANGTYSITVGAIKCNDGDTNTSGTWFLDDDGKSIIMSTERWTYEITINKLVLSQGSLVYTLIPA